MNGMGEVLVTLLFSFRTRFNFIHIMKDRNAFSFCFDWPKEPGQSSTLAKECTSRHTNTHTAAAPCWVACNKCLKCITAARHGGHWGLSAWHKSLHLLVGPPNTRPAACAAPAVWSALHRMANLWLWLPALSPPPSICPSGLAGKCSFLRFCLPLHALYTFTALRPARHALCLPHTWLN